MLLSKSQTACQRSNSISNTITNTNIKPPVQLRTQQASTGSAKRRDLLASLVSGAGVTALLLTPKDASAATDFLSSMNSSSNSGGGGLTIAPLNTAAKKAMDERDSAMEYQCKGGNGESWLQMKAVEAVELLQHPACEPASAA